MIQTPEGDCWAVFLAVRPYDGKNKFNTGRETFLLPVVWENDYPIILKKRLPVPLVVDKKNLSPAETRITGNFECKEEFNDVKLDYSWIHIRTHEEEFYTIDKGKLKLTALPVSIEEQKSPAALVRRQKHSTFTVETQLEFSPKTENDFAGLTLFQNERFQFLFGKTIENGKVVLNVYRMAKDKILLASVVISGKQTEQPIRLLVNGDAGTVDFSYSFDGETWIKLVEKADATNLSTQVAGGFIGTTIGMYATSKHQFGK
jgi:xylan 1,4-beta-xylosidase